MATESVEQLLQIARQGAGLKFCRAVCQADDQITGREPVPLATEVVTDDSFQPVAVNCLFEQFLANDQTQTGGIASGWQVVQHQPLPANRSPETKNG